MLFNCYFVIIVPLLLLLPPLFFFLLCFNPVLDKIKFRYNFILNFSMKRSLKILKLLDIVEYAATFVAFNFM